MQETSIYLQELLIYQQKLNRLLMESSRQVWAIIPMVQVFFNNRYACPQILAVLEEDLNVLVGGTFQNNRKGFPVKYDCLTIPRGC